MEYREAIELICRSIEMVGITVVIVGAIVATVAFIHSWMQDQDMIAAFRGYRQNLGRAILVGLEFLIASDIISSVADRPTLQTVLTLGIIVLIRSFLSIELEMEIEGKWPWQRSLQEFPHKNQR